MLRSPEMPTAPYPSQTPLKLRGLLFRKPPSRRVGGTPGCPRSLHARALIPATSAPWRGGMMGCRQALRDRSATRPRGWLVLDILAASTGRAQSSSQPLTLTLDHVDTTDQIDDLRRSQKNRRRSAAESRAQRRIQKETLSREKRARREAVKEARADAKRQKKATRQLLCNRKWAQAAAREEKRRQRNRCLACHATYRGGRLWGACEACNMASVCGKCENGNIVMEEQGHECSGSKRKKPRSR